MKRLLPLAFAFLVLAARVGFAAGSSATTLLHPAVSVNGVSCTGIVSWDGGDLRASVVATGTNKHIVNVSYDPVVIEATLPLAAPLVTLFNDLCGNGPARATLVMTRYSFNNTAGPSIQATNAQLLSVKFPTLDASAASKSASVILTFAPEAVQSTATPAPLAASGSSQARVTMGLFALQLAGLDGTRVTQIESFTLGRLAPLSTGSELRTATSSAPVGFPNLIVTLTVNGSSTWTAWRDSFLLSGNSTDADEKSGSLTLSAAANPAITFALQLSHVGLVRLTAVPTDTDTIPKYEAELYVEGITIGPSPASSGGTTTSTPSATPAPADSTGKPTATPVPSRETTKPTVAPKVAAPSQPTPANLVAPLKNSATRNAIVPTNPNDKGARDPLNFPRAEGLTRKTYTSIKSKDSNQENVLYTSSGPMEKFAAFYDETLKADGWEESRRMENDYGLDHTHQMIVTSYRAKDSVIITYTDVKPGTVEIQVNLTRAVVP